MWALGTGGATSFQDQIKLTTAELAKAAGNRHLHKKGGIF
jgi:hypothetical protein